MTFTLNRPRSNICAEYLKIPPGVQKISSGEESEMERQTDGHTEKGAKNNRSQLHGGRHNSKMVTDTYLLSAQHTRKSGFSPLKPCLKNKMDSIWNEQLRMITINLK